MKDRIEKVLLSYDVEFSNDSTYSERGIRREDYAELAEKLVKLFLIPPVIKSVCQCSEPINQMTNKGMYCLRCENPIR